MSKEERVAWALRGGEFYVCVWGMGDRIVDFYLVIKRTPKTVTLHKVEQERVKSSPAGPSGDALCVPTLRTCKPREGCTADCGCSVCENSRPFRKKVQENGSINLSSHQYAKPWDGKPVRETWGNW